MREDGEPYGELGASVVHLRVGQGERLVLGSLRLATYEAAQIAVTWAVMHSRTLRGCLPVRDKALKRKQRLFSLHQNVVMEAGKWMVVVGGDSATAATTLAVLVATRGLSLRSGVCVSAAMGLRGELMPVGGVDIKVKLLDAFR
jgi:hypothetical protein